MGYLLIGSTTVNLLVRLKAEDLSEVSAESDEGEMHAPSALAILFYVRLDFALSVTT